MTWSVTDIPSQTGRTAVVTGANGGPVQTVDYSKLSTDLLLELSKAITDAAPQDHDGGPRLN